MTNCNAVPGFTELSDGPSNFPDRTPSKTEISPETTFSGPSEPVTENPPDESCRQDAKSTSTFIPLLMSSLSSVVNLAGAWDYPECISAKVHKEGPFVFRVIQDDSDASRDTNEREEITDRKPTTVQNPNNEILEVVEQPLPVVLFDRSLYCAAVVLHPTPELMAKRESIISASGLTVGFCEADNHLSRLTPFQERMCRGSQVTFAPNERKRQPFLYVSKFQIVPEKKILPSIEEQGAEFEKVNGRPSGWAIRPRPTKCKWLFPSGNVAALLSTYSLDIDSLSGGTFQLTRQQDAEGFENVQEDIAVVDDYLEQHNAIKILDKDKNGHRSSARRLMSQSFSDPARESIQNYLNALNGFDGKQRETEVASVRRAMDKKCEPKKDQAVTQFSETLQYALTCKDEPLAGEMLIRWHYWLMGDGLYDRVGVLRCYEQTAAWEHSSESYRNHNRMDRFCEVFERHWLPQLKAGSTNAKDIATFAAAALVTFFDILPFYDGNHRFSSILLNWVLRRCGLPFCVNVHDGEGKYNLLLLLNRALQGSYHIPLGDAGVAGVAQALKRAGGLDPIVRFLLRQMAQAVDDLNVLIREKAKWTTEECNARIVRQARETALETQCFVCFEGSPNISTLCCGKPVHFNCLAQWLGSHPSCPQCRSRIPTLRTASSLPFQSSTPAAEEDSEVERLLHFITNDPSDDSSSDSWPSSSDSSSDTSSNQSSSSSSSSSTSSALSFDVASALRFDSNDEDESREHDTDAGRRTYRWISESEDDSDDQHFFNAHLAPFEESIVGVDDGTLDSHLAREEEVGESRNNTGTTDGSRRNDFRSVQGGITRDGGQVSVPADIVLFSSADTTPRMSFLDPVLLVNVQRGNQDMDVTRRSVFVDSSSTGDEHDVDEDLNDLMPFARNPASNAVSPESLERDDFIFPRNFVIRNHVLSSRYDAPVSDGYDPETVDDNDFFVPGEEETTDPHGEAPPLCLQPRCHNHAHAECCNKRCFSCCVKRGVDCPVHAGRFSQPLLDALVERG